MAAASDEVNRLRLELGAAEQSRDAIKRELSSEVPQLPLEALPFRQPAAPSEADLRLEAQRRLLDELLRRYTDEHPDVVATRRNITQIEAQRRQEVAAQARNSGPSAPTNPCSAAEALAGTSGVARRPDALAAWSAQGRLELVRRQLQDPQIESTCPAQPRLDVVRRNHHSWWATRIRASAPSWTNRHSGGIGSRACVGVVDGVFPSSGILASCLARHRGRIAEPWDEFLSPTSPTKKHCRC